MKALKSDNVKRIQGDPLGREQLVKVISSGADESSITLSDGTSYIMSNKKPHMKPHKKIPWLKLTYQWLSYKKSAYKDELMKMQTVNSVTLFQFNIMLTTFMGNEQHWTYRKFVAMCDKEIERIKAADEDL